MTYGRKFASYTAGFKQTETRALDIFRATRAPQGYGSAVPALNPTQADVFVPEVAQARNVEVMQDLKNGLQIKLPKHLYIPENAQSVDLRRVDSVNPATTIEIIRFTCPQSTVVRFIGYGVFSDATNFGVIGFLPLVNGNRILPFHGDPQNGFKIGLGLAPDLSNNSIIQCSIKLSPGDLLQWYATNGDPILNNTLGVRMVGYVDVDQIRRDERFGG